MIRLRRTNYGVAMPHLNYDAVRGHEHGVCKPRSMNAQQYPRARHGCHLLLERQLAHLLDPVQLEARVAQVLDDLIDVDDVTRAL